jgi:transcriptional regulator with XRE-family HTH domain
MNKFIERLKQLRTEKNLSQAQLAKEIDVTQPAIAYWETGKKIPNAQAIITLAQYFGVTTDYLLGLED